MQTITVDMTPGFRQPTIHYSQNDVGTTFAIDLRSRFGDTLPASPTVKIQATKPSGFGFSIEADSVVDSVATFTTVDTMTDEAGRFQAELQIIKDAVVIYTANFYMEGEANPHPTGTTDGSQETVIPTLTLLVERVEAAASSVLDMTVEAETLAAGSQATYSYDEDTNTATFGIPQGEAGAGAAGVTASAYSASRTYAVGDYVIHNNNLYRCTTAITTAEAFTAAHWTQVVLGDDVCDLKSDIDHKISFTTNLYDGSSYENLFINNTAGQIQLSANGALVYIPCVSDRTYKVTKTAGKRFAVATTAILPANGVPLIDCIPNNTASQITIKTSAGSKYLCAWVYLSTADTTITLSDMLASVEIYDETVYEKLSASAVTIKAEDSTAISSNADLNTYESAGNYKIGTTAIANTVLNIPIKSSGKLTVITGADRLSPIQIYLATTGGLFVRSKTSGYWGEWISLLGKGVALQAVYSETIPSDSDVDDYTSVGEYRITSKSTAKTISNLPSKFGGRLIVLQLYSSSSIHQIYIDSNGDWYTREKFYNGYGDWHKFTTDAEWDEANTVSASKAAYNVLRVMMDSMTYNMTFANAFSPLKLKNYLGNNQNVHPKVLYFANGFGGHKYWMAYTPYPYSNDDFENPCIAYSDDGINWIDIDGNPIDDPNGVGYNSDAHLVYRSDTSTLECWYRYVGDASQSPREETIYRQTTLDGVTWSQKEIVYSNTSGQYAKLLSPAIIIDDNKYCIWVVNGNGGNVIDYYEAPITNVTNWTKVRSITITCSDGGTSVKPWHIDVIKDSGTYIILAMCRNSTSIDVAKWSLFIATSSNNVSYGTPAKVVGGVNNWDKYMYRSSIVKIDGSYRIYYSACNGGKTTVYNGATWGIGITESEGLSEFIGLYV